MNYPQIICLAPSAHSIEKSEIYQAIRRKINGHMEILENFNKIIREQNFSEANSYRNYGSLMIL